MPSVRASRWKAAIASSSVAEVYSTRPRVVQPDVLGADRRIVEAGRDRVGLRDLPLVVLEHQGAGAVQHAEPAAVEARGVLAQARAAAARLDADQAHARGRRGRR